jgi:hypothetical protein
MSIVINEFEVVREADPSPQDKATQPQPERQSIGPQEIMAVIEREAERVARVWAT